MNILNIINDIHKENSSEIDLLVNNHDKKDIFSIKGLEQLFPNGISKKNSILFYGDTESGKSLLAINMVNNNDNLIFAYIDTHMQINSNLSNMLLIRMNSKDDILSLLEQIDDNLIDVLILDDLSFIYTDEEKSRITEINDFLINLYRICSSKNIFLFLLNTVNGKGEMYMSNSKTILHNTNTIVRLSETNLNDMNINISGVIEKSKYSNKNKMFSFKAERM